MGNVVLIGFMGCGKSSVAVKLSYRLKRQMTDTDRLIEKKQGKSIREIFEQDGEEAFRQMETQTLQELKETAKNQVISVGGGTPEREENRTLMKEIGKVVYLRAKAETLYERLKKDTNRPLLQGGDEDLKTKIQGLLEKRSSAYEEAADLIIDVDDKPFGQVLYEIERGIRPSYRDNANTASEEGGYKGKYSQRYPLGQRFGYGTRTPYGKPSYGTFGSYGQSAAGSRFLSAGVLRMMDTLKGFTDTDKYLFDRRKGPVLWISALWAVLLWAAGRGRSALLQTAVFPCGGRKRKEKVSAQAFGHQRSQLKLPWHPRKRNLWHAGL